MTDKKFSDLPDAGTLTGDELVALVQQVNEQNTSLKVTLAILKNFFGDITVVDVGVNLNTLREPGIYLLQGGETFQASYSLNYPGGLQPGSRVIMMVSAEASPGNVDNVTQTYLSAKLFDSPCPYSRLSSGGTWGAWSQPLAESRFNSRALQQLNMSTSGTDLHNVGNNSTSNIWAFPAPTEAGGGGPMLNTAPSNKPGIHFSLLNPYARSVVGTYKGNVIITDSDGRVFTNVDNTYLTDKENPNGVNWRELITVEMKSRKAISMPMDGQNDQMMDALKMVIQVMRDNHMILPGNATVTDVVTFPHSPEVTSVERGSSSIIDVYTLPWFGDLVVYARTVDSSIATVPESIQILGFAQDDSLTPGTMTKYGYGTIEVAGVGVGSTAIEFSNDSEFTTVLATMAVEVTEKPLP